MKSIIRDISKINLLGISIIWRTKEITSGKETYQREWCNSASWNLMYLKIKKVCLSYGIGTMGGWKFSRLQWIMCCIKSVRAFWISETTCCAIDHQFIVFVQPAEQALNVFNELQTFIARLFKMKGQDSRCG